MSYTQQTMTRILMYNKDRISLLASTQIKLIPIPHVTSCFETSAADLIGDCDSWK